MSFIHPELVLFVLDNNKNDDKQFHKDKYRPGF